MAMFLFAFICACCITGTIYGAARLLQAIDERRK